MLSRSRCFHSINPRQRISRQSGGNLQKYCTHTNSSLPSWKTNTVSANDISRTKSIAHRLKVDSRIIPESLHETIEVHRRANQISTSQAVVPNRASRQASKKRTHAAGSTQSTAGEKYKRLNLIPATSQRGDYGGRSIPLTWEWKASAVLPKRLRVPWAHRLEIDMSINHNVPAIRRLSDELQAVQTYLGPTPEEDLAAQKALADVLNVLSKAPDCDEVHYSVMGSRAAAIHGPLSDVDLSVKILQSRFLTKQQSNHILKALFKFLKYTASADERTTDVVAYGTRMARFPILDCGHLAAGLRFQIQCPQDNYDTIETTKAYLAEFRYLEQIYRVVKQMLTMRGLSAGNHGGITSYPLFHMVVASLKLQGANKDSAFQLLDFLRLYSEIDFYTTAIEYHHQRSDVKHADKPPIAEKALGYDPLSVLPKLVPRDRQGLPYLMSLQDPANLDNDLGRNGTMIKHVQAVFIEALERITSAMNLWDEMYERGIDMRAHGKAILAWCLEGDYTRLETERRQLRSFALSQDEV